MGNVLMQVVGGVNAIMLLSSEASEASKGQFPFLAALILVAIIVVVSIGDMMVADKKRKETNDSVKEDQDEHLKS